MKTRIGFQQLCAVTALLALVSAQMAPAQQAGLPANGTHALTAPASAPKATAKAPAGAQEEENAAAAGKPDGNGIKIHGHWRFVVHDPDGKLVSEREFENSLLTPTLGDQVLTLMLVGKGMAADWGVVLCSAPAGPGANGSGGVLCAPQSGNGSRSAIVVLVAQTTNTIGSALCNSNPGDGFPCVTGLQTSTPGLTLNVAQTIVFSGNYTATHAVSVAAVQTVLAYCAPLAGQTFATISPQACDGLSFLNYESNGQSNGSGLFTSLFTGTNLATPQTLTAGQILTVTVTFSFS